MTNESFPSGEFSPRLQALVARAVAPADLQELSDAQVEAILDAESAEPFSEEQLAALLHRSQRFSAEGVSAGQSSEENIAGHPAPGLPVAPSADAEVAVPRSPILGFLGNFTSPGGSFTPTLWSILVLLSCATMLGLIGVLVVRGIHVHLEKDEGGRMKDEEFATNPPPVPIHPSSFIPQPSFSSPVARLTRTADCRWTDPGSSPQLGDILGPGRELRLSSGVIELNFDVGVRAVVQGPARLDLLTKSKVFLYSGKISSEILKPEARGFEVRTSKGSVVDLGTEFGVEVTSSQDVQVHVFKGEVVVNEPAAQDSAAPCQHLLCNQGLRLDGTQSFPRLVEGLGETFIRSIDNADRDRHVIAYWRFEDRPVGALLPETGKNSEPIRATVDSSFNGNDLYSFNWGSQPVFSRDVPAACVPQSGNANRSCLDTSQPPDPGDCRNVYTHSEFSHASPFDVQTITPAQWTIEASVKMARLADKAQPFIVRDATYTQKPQRGPARLVFQINARGRFAIGFFDVSNRFREAVADDLTVQANRWYHVAAASDGVKLRLYVDALDGRGYVLRASQDLPATGSTALGKGADDAEWAIGRGNNREAKDQVAQQFYGWIDEVRISDIARGPEDLLFAPRDSRKP